MPPVDSGGDVDSQGNYDFSKNDTSATLTVAGLTGAITNVDVLVNIPHQFSEDLEIYLLAPDEPWCHWPLKNPPRQRLRQHDFQRNAPTPVDFAAAPYTFVQPDSGLRFDETFTTLGALVGMAPAVANGQWELVVEDDEPGNIGTLVSWSVIISTTPPTNLINNGNPMDQNQDAVPDQTGLDAFAVPTPVNGLPFQLPYTTDSLPLIIPARIPLGTPCRARRYPPTMPPH